MKTFGQIPQPQPRSSVDLAQIRTRLQGLRGQDYWRGLEELAATNEFLEMLHREFPAGASEWWDGVSRRSFLKLAAATMALAGLSACTKQPAREILPYVRQPPELVPGEALVYASAMVLGGFATGVLVKSREGHPIKVDGNPDHPASLGGSSVWMQTSILNLYDPDRSQTVLRGGHISTWALFLSDLNEVLRESEFNQGASLRFLTETVSSPTLKAQLEDLLRRFPAAKWCQYEPVIRDNIREGARLAFGQFVETQYRFDRAEVIVSLDADFLYTHPQRLRYTRDFISARRLSAGKRVMSRLYVAESTPTVTGTMADHRLPLGSAEIEDLAQGLAQALGAPARAGGDSKYYPLSSKSEPREGVARWISAAVQDLNEHRGASIIIAGEWQPAIVHGLAHLLNQSLGNTGNTVYYTETAESKPVNQLQSLRDLAAEMKAGVVDTLFILGGNPAYNAPVDLEFGPNLTRVKRSIHLGLEVDETAALCAWHIPQADYLESWGDARGFDGTISLLQPLIAPLYDGKTALELLGALSRQQPVRSDYELVREFWRNQGLWPDFEKSWRRALHDGFIAGTETPGKEVRVQPGFESRSVTKQPLPNVRISFPERTASGGEELFDVPRRKEVRIENLEVCFRPDPNLWDGCFANNGWLQECPKPVNKLTWDNAILISPTLAERSGLQTGDVAEVSLHNRALRGPIWIMPGQAENTLTLHLGYGRSRVGRVGQGVGFNAYQLRTTGAFWQATGATLVTTGESHPLVSTQTHHSLESPERQIFRAATLEQLRVQPELIRRSVVVPSANETLYNPQEYKYEGYRWGMSIDLTACIGCNACVVACEVENNIPVVGKDQVSRRREMLWLRVDTYYKGELDNPEFNHMPVPCMHCEHAPCELVCPVAATVHDSEGLNLQVYNRCVGTRFCSNNCPYKVRRFNFLRYSDDATPNYKPMHNPEVTVRGRGVMEKCTYCVQRISAARISSERENRRIRDGEVRTACQEACPAQAIVFGDLNDPNSQVTKLKREPLDYPMLGQLNTRPRTTYLAKVQNPKPEFHNLSSADTGGDPGG